MLTARKIFCILPTKEAIKIPVHDFREKHYEIINGKKILFASDTLCENMTTGHLLMLLANHVKTNRLGFVFIHLHVYLPDGNLFIPDIIFVDKSKEKLVMDSPEDEFNIVPDMVAEIFSKSTMKRDIGIKKDVYERNGVKEYWMIDPWSENVQVYLLRDGKYFLDEVYQNYSDEELKNLTDEERAEVQMEIPVAVLDGFKVKIRNIFGWYFE